MKPTAFSFNVLDLKELLDRSRCSPPEHAWPPGDAIPSRGRLCGCCPQPGRRGSPGHDRATFVQDDRSSRQRKGHVSSSNLVFDRQPAPSDSPASHGVPVSHLHLKERSSIPSLLRHSGAFAITRVESSSGLAEASSASRIRVDFRGTIRPGGPLTVEKSGVSTGLATKRQHLCGRV